MTIRRLALLLAASALVTGPASTATARTDEPLGGVRRDPVGDVQPASSEPVDPAELDRIDLTSASWSVVPGRRVKVRMELVDIKPGQLRAKYFLKARIGRAEGALFLVATPGGVRVASDGSRRCRGSRSTIDAARDVVRMTIPVHCLPDDRYTFAPHAFLEDRQLGELRYDRVDRSDWVSVR